MAGVQIAQSGGLVLRWAYTQMHTCAVFRVSITHEPVFLIVRRVNSIEFYEKIVLRRVHIQKLRGACSIKQAIIAGSRSRSGQARCRMARIGPALTGLECLALKTTYNPGAHGLMRTGPLAATSKQNFRVVLPVSMLWKSKYLMNLVIPSTVSPVSSDTSRMSASSSVSPGSTAPPGISQTPE